MGLCATFLGDGDNSLVLREWAPQYRRRVWESGLANVGITDAAVAATLADRFSELRAMHYRPYPDVLPALVQLSQRYRMGLITNGVPDLQRTKLRFAQLHHRFSPLLIAGELGVGKPMVQVYKHLLNALRLPPERVLLVEDSLTNIEGAARLGIRTVHVTRGTVSPSCRTIGTLNDLTTLLGC